MAKAQDNSPQACRARLIQSIELAVGHIEDAAKEVEKYHSTGDKALVTRLLAHAKSNERLLKITSVEGKTTGIWDDQLPPVLFSRVLGERR